MTTKTDGGAAFPSRFEIKGPAYDPIKDKNVEPGTTEVYIQLGMSLRDWFAGLALQGICSSGPGREWGNARLAQEAYQQADAMLAERENKS